MTTNVVIRETRTDDREEVLALVRSAFSGDTRDGSEEIGIVETTWSVGPAAEPIDLVAVDRDRLVGHVLAAAGTLGSCRVQAVAPLGVLPSHQRAGVGSTLMGDLLGRADAAGWPMVVLLGSPLYYGRFGFEASGPLGITYPAVGADSPHFLVRRLSSYNPAITGDFTYCFEGGPSGT